ncbi:MAG: TetR family transcriptional regulator [Chloroflexi bacterium]|nr:TetR family transcriptional regulator [Chloroflexota bacterium]
MIKEKRPDRRVIRTRNMLRTALLALIAERGYDAISVADIADRADLRRATFYLHYKDKEGLLLATLEGMFDELVGQIEAASGGAEGDLLAEKTAVETWRIMFAHVAAHRALYRDLFASASASAITRRIRGYLAGRLLKSLSGAPTGALSIPAQVLANYLAGAEVGLIQWWLESDSAYTPEEMAVMAQRLALDGARGALRTK